MDSQLKRVFSRYDCGVYTRGGAKLGDLLCGNNKTRPSQLDKKGVYKLRCSACGKEYVGETRVSVRRRVQQHRDGVHSSSSTSANVSGITRHARECDFDAINWNQPEVLATYQDKRKTVLQQNLFVRESLEILRQETGPGKGLNVKDDAKSLGSTAWGPILKRVGK